MQTINIHDLTNTQGNNIALARERATKSNLHSFRHGAVIVSSGKVIGLGHNHARTKMRRRNFCSFHAEIDAMSYVLRGSFQSYYRKPTPIENDSKKHNNYSQQQQHQTKVAVQVAY